MKLYISVNGPPRDDNESREKYGKTPSVTSLKRTKWRVYSHYKKRTKG